MKRSSFKIKMPAARVAKQYTGTNPSAARVPAVRIADQRTQAVVPLPKQNPLQHAGYMGLVRLLPCDRCGFYRKGLIQFCHSDETKGMGIKSDCRRGWPGCAPHDSIMGCHWVVGSSGRMAQAERRAFEREAGARTRAKIVAAGQWPKRLPFWPE